MAAKENRCHGRALLNMYRQMISIAMMIGFAVAYLIITFVFLA
jgi:hypothetical protein